MLEIGSKIRDDILLSAMRDSSGSQEKHTHSPSGFVIIPDSHLLMNSEIIVTVGLYRVA